MNVRAGALALVCFSSVVWASAYAQVAQPADFIVAVVNSVPITHSELMAAVKRTTQGLQHRRQVIPAADTLRRKVLDQMISDRAQLQLAQETGIRDRCGHRTGGTGCRWAAAGGSAYIA